MGLCASAYTKNDCNKWHGIHSSPPNKVHRWRFQYQKANKSKTRAHTHSYPSAASPKIPNPKSSSSTFWLIFAMAKYYIRLNKTPETRRRHIERHAFYCKDFAYKYQSIEKLYSQVYTCVRVFSQMTNAQQEKVCAKNHNHMMYVTFTLEVIYLFFLLKKVCALHRTYACDKDRLQEYPVRWIKSFFDTQPSHATIILLLLL